MQPLFRPVRFLALVFVLAVIIPSVPASVSVQTTGSEFSTALLVRQLLHPFPILLALLTALSVAGPRGLGQAASACLGRDLPAEVAPRAARALAVGTRVWMWSACLWSAAVVISFYWPAPPHESTGLATFAGLAFVKHAALPIALLGLLFLLPLSEELETGPRGAKRWLDLMPPLVSLACLFTLLLRVYTYRPPVIGQEPASPTLAPAFDTLGAGFVAWGVVVPLALMALALAPVASRTPARVVRAALAAGTAAAFAVMMHGMNEIAVTGGTGDPRELASLAGRMLVVLACALGLGALGALKLPPRVGRLEPGLAPMTKG